MTDEGKNVQTTQPAPAASAVGPCPTVIKIVGRPGTGSLPSTIAPPDHPQNMIETGIGRANECYSLRQARGHNRDIFRFSLI